MKIQTILFLVISCCIISCETNHNKLSEQTVTTNPLENENWLIGKWGSKEEGVETTEIWGKENDSVYAGSSYSIKMGTDTISFERIRLEKQTGKWMYIPVVNSQNKDKIIKFALTSSNHDELIFENPQHDFPQKISYKLIHKDSLLAEISGVYKGKEQSEKFPMHRLE